MKAKAQPSQEQILRGLEL